MTLSTAMLPTVLRKKSDSTFLADTEFNPGSSRSSLPNLTLLDAAAAAAVLADPSVPGAAAAAAEEAFVWQYSCSIRCVWS